MDLEKLGHILEQLPKQIENLHSILNGLDSRLDKLEKTVYNEFLAKSLGDRYVPIDVVIRELGISRRKLFYMKERMEIEVIALGKHLFVTGDEIDRLMKKHTIKINKDE